MSTNPTNPETLLGNHPAGYVESELIASTRREIQNAIGIIDRLFPANAPVTGNDLHKLAADLGTHYAGGDDGPIREPGDTMPNGDDAATDDIDAVTLEVVRLRKQVRQLEAEKTVARAWIAELLGGTKKSAAGRARIELLHEEIARLQADTDVEESEYAHE